MVKLNFTRHQKELGLAQRERNPDEPIKVFLASPRDVEKLRDAFQQVINEEHNQAEIAKTGRVKFQVFRWETTLESNFVGDQIQEEIFRDFGDWCDIFVLLLWGKLGSGGTEEEYEKFLGDFRAVNKNIRLWALVYNEKIYYEQVDTPQLDKLRQFVQTHQSSWVQIGRTPGCIQSVDEFKTEVRRLLNSYEVPG